MGEEYAKEWKGTMEIDADSTVSRSFACSSPVCILGVDSTLLGF